MKEYLKHLLIRTPFEKTVKKIQGNLNFRQQQNHPELYEIYIESLRIEKALHQIIDSSSNCIDIGCHLGSILSEILKISPQGHHMAFEPIPYKARWLRQKFPEVDIKEIALSNTTGEVSFYINSQQTALSGLSWHNKGKNKTYKEIKVQSNKLDNILASDRRIDFIKIDVEGNELATLRGAVNIINNYHPTWLFECTKSGLSSFGFTSKEVFDFLMKHQYSIFLIKVFLEDGHPLNFEQFDNALQYPFQAFNFIASVKY